jgi:GDP-D-mannose dehydratase
MLQQNVADDFVIATGKQISVREFVSLSAKEVGIELEFTGEGLEEIATVMSFTGDNVEALRLEMSLCVSTFVISVQLKLKHYLETLQKKN